MNKKWELYNLDENVIKNIEKKYNISNLLATVLVNREIINDEEIKVFLEPTRKDFHDPFQMPDMNKAVDRIIKAMKNKEKVIIYGDYDVDGITSTVVLKSFLDEHGLNVDYKIPNRLNEGYGLNKNAIKEIADKGYNLIITVDCGISGIEEIKYANELGMEVIVTDHHEPLDEIPDAVAVIDCKRKDNKYPFKSLAGCGVVFKLIQAISIKQNYNEKDYLNAILRVLEDGKLDDIELYKEGNYVCYIASQILNIDEVNIYDRYDSLPIKKLEDIDISGKEIIDLLNLEDKSIVKIILNDLEEKIILKKLDNKKEVLIKYIIDTYN